MLDYALEMGLIQHGLADVQMKIVK